MTKKISHDQLFVKKRGLIIIILILIIPLSIGLIYGLNQQINGSLIDIDENDQYWSLIPEDQLTYLISEKYTQDNKEFYFNKELIRQTIAEINDQNFDQDQYSDLTIFTEMLLGFTDRLHFDVGSQISLQGFEKLLGSLWEVINLKEANPEIVLPTFSAFTTSYSQIWSNLNRMMEYTLANNFSDTTINYEGYTNSPFEDLDELRYIDFINNSVGNGVSFSMLPSNRSYSRGIEFKVENKDTLSNENKIGILHTRNDWEIWGDYPHPTHANISFYVYPNENVSLIFDLSNFEFVNDTIRKDYTCHSLLFTNNSIYMYEKNFTSGNLEDINLKAGNWTKIANLSSNEWHHIELFYVRDVGNNYIYIDYNTTAIEYFAGYGRLCEPYLAYHLGWVSFGVENATNNGESAYIDDLYDIWTFSDGIDFNNPFEFLNFFSLNELMILPTHLNYTYLIDFLAKVIKNSQGIDLETPIDEFWHTLTSEPFPFIYDEGNTFSIHITDQLIRDIGLENPFYENDVNIFIDVVWDLSINCLSSIELLITYNDLEIEREINVSLVQSSSSQRSVNGYYYYTSQFLDPNSERIYKNAQINSILNDDEYSNDMDSSNFEASFIDFINRYFEEFGYEPIISVILSKYIVLIVFSIIGIIGIAMIPTTILINSNFSIKRK